MAKKAKTNGSFEKLARDPERVARMKLILERTATVKLKRELLQESYVRRSDVEQANVERIRAIRAKLSELPGKAPLIAGKTEAECAALLAGWVQEVFDYFATGNQ